MLTVKVKICGITNYEDAAAAVDMGAHILGFNFYPKSPRYIPPSKAQEIIGRLPSFVDSAGVFVNAVAEEIHPLTGSGFLNWIQFHGDETPEFCAQFNMWNVRTIKAVRVRSREAIEQAAKFRTYALLFDSFNPNLYGGTGESFDWSLIRDCSRRVFLAGGLNPDNVADALDVGVYALDIGSGVESSPGKKDHTKMKRLFDNIHNHIGMKVNK